MCLEYKKIDIRMDIYFFCIQERETGIEPATPSLARRCSTAEPLAHVACYQQRRIYYNLPGMSSTFFIIPAKSQNSYNPQNSSRSKKVNDQEEFLGTRGSGGTKTMLRAHKSCPSPIRCIKRRNRGVEFHKENLTESDIRLDILP